jgi:hypothetical protein
VAVCIAEKKFLHGCFIPAKSVFAMKTKRGRHCLAKNALDPETETVPETPDDDSI